MSIPIENKGKIVLVGETQTGKSSLINRLIFQKFEYLCNTICAGVFNKIFKYNSRRKIKLEIWDTSGQKKYMPFTKIFIKNADVVVFVYSIINKASFEEIKNYWYGEIKKICLKEPSIYLFNFNSIFFGSK